MVARDVWTGFIAVRDTDCVVRPVVVVRGEFVVVRVAWVGAVARETVERFIVFAVRAVVFRADVLLVGRDATDDVVVRVVILRDDETFVLRVPEFVVARKAASATPMHIKHATRKDSVFFILGL